MASDYFKDELQDLADTLCNEFKITEVELWAWTGRERAEVATYKCGSTLYAVQMTFEYGYPDLDMHQVPVNDLLRMLAKALTHAAFFEEISEGVDKWCKTVEQMIQERGHIKAFRELLLDRMGLDQLEMAE
jgi:hypothetical protein